MLRLIVNADDLGLTRGVNRAIFHGQTEGIVTSATLMANAPAFDDAVAELLRSPLYRNRQRGIGCHVVLIDGQPLMSVDKIPTLLEGPRFRRKLWKFALAAMTGKISITDIEREATAQVRKLQEAGLEVSHVDCHKHSHMFPVVLAGVLLACKATGVRAIRNPFEPAFARVGQKDRTRAFETSILRAFFAAGFQKRVQQAGIQTTDGSLGVTATGTLDLAGILTTLRNLPPDGTFEFICHPGYSDADLASAGTRLQQSRETELQLLCSPEVQEVLRSSPVKLANFWDIVSPAESKPVAVHPMP